MKIGNVQEKVKIEKSNKWFHARKFFQMVSHLHVVSIMQDDGITSTQVISPQVHVCEQYMS